MHAMGVSANLISLGAVDFGVIIDSAVVMVEALMVRLAVDANPNTTGSSRRWGGGIHALKADLRRARFADHVLEGHHHRRLPADLHLPAHGRADLSPQWR